jgi:hypothetical protein
MRDLALQELRGGTRNAALACGSKVLHLFFLDDFGPVGPKSSRKGRKSTALPKAKTTFAR